MTNRFVRTKLQLFDVCLAGSRIYYSMKSTLGNNPAITHSISLHIKVTFAYYLHTFNHCKTIFFYNLDKCFRATATVEKNV